MAFPLTGGTPSASGVRLFRPVAVTLVPVNVTRGTWPTGNDIMNPPWGQRSCAGTRLRPEYGTTTVGSSPPTTGQLWPRIHQG
jgi:hypothetical protein